MNGGGPAVPANAGPLGLAELGPNDCSGEVKEKDGEEVGCLEATVVRKLNLFALEWGVAVAGTAGCGVAVKGLGVEGEGKDCRMPGAG